MKRIFMLTLLLLPLAKPAAAGEQTMKLSLGEAIRLAAEKNLDVRAEFYNPAQFEADINRNRAIYDPLLALVTEYADKTTPPSLGSSIGSNGETFNADASINQLLWTGGTLAAQFNNKYSVNSNVQCNGQNCWQSSLGVAFSQPLLKNAGQEATELSITISKLSKYASIEHLNTRLMNTVAQVRTDYFKLYSLREQLEVRKVSLELSRKILTETKARVAAGVLPAMEILNAEFGVSSREKDVIDAEKAVSDQLDVVRQLLQIGDRADIATTDQPRRDLYQMAEEDLIRRAMTRPDIKAQRRALEIAELQTRVYANNLKPDFKFSATAGISGLERSYSRDMEKMWTMDSPYWSVGLTFTQPLGNRAAENDYRKSRLKADQTAVQIKSLEDGAAKDVRAAVRGVSTGYKQIEVAERGRSYAEERLKAFIRKNEVGLATTKDVLDVENDLATAKNNLITALVGYDNAITLLQQVSGELLERSNIHIVDSDVDRLYKNIR